jgi:hypothetical protein
MDARRGFTRLEMNVSDEEMIGEIEKQIEAGTDLEGLIPVRSTAPKNPRTVFSIRLAPEELRDISQAARGRGMSIGDFLRNAARRAVDQDKPGATDDDYSIADFQADVARLSRKLEQSLARRQESLKKGA